MQNDKICSDIVSQLATTRTEVNILLTEIDILLRSIYKTGAEDFSHTIQGSIRAKTAYMITTAVSGDNSEAVLNNIKAKLNSLIYLGLTLAFEPNLEIISQLTMWTKTNLGEGIALDITVDRRILGGAVIEYKGKIITSTLLSKIDSYFQTNYANF